jgi:hypothetical protein
LTLDQSASRLHREAGLSLASLLTGARDDGMTLDLS